MLLVVRPGRESEVEAVFRKWDLEAAAVGRIRNHGQLTVRRDGRTVAEVPCRALTDEAPVLRRPMAPPKHWPPRKITAEELPEPSDWNETALRMIGSPGLASRRFIYEQYDHMVRSDTVVRPGGDAGVVRIKGTPLALAMTLDGNGRVARADPRRGGALAVSEACRNLAAVGASPVGATNCLNFGNPEKPEVMWQFSEAVSGMCAALEAFGVPITGGNVSFYNETDGAGVFPTPVVGLVGVIEDLEALVRQHFAAPGDLVFLAGLSGAAAPEGLGVGECLKVIHGRTDGRPAARLPRAPLAVALDEPARRPAVVLPEEGEVLPPQEDPAVQADQRAARSTPRRDPSSPVLPAPLAGRPGAESGPQNRLIQRYPSGQHVIVYYAVRSGSQLGSWAGAGTISAGRRGEPAPGAAPCRRG